MQYVQIAMIKDIINIHNIGRFSKYDKRGDLAFRRYTLVFAENGRGKTTLCSILRSLQSNDVDPILERRTLGAEGDPHVQILLSNGRAAFAAGAWSTNFSELMIFDQKFVSDNVFSGDTIDAEHRQNLYRVILGVNGVKLAHKVEAINNGIRVLNAEIAENKKKIEREMPRQANFEKFLEMGDEEEIDRKIEQQERIVVLARSAAEIAKKPLLSGIDLPELQADFFDILDAGLEDISADAESRIKEHLHHHGMDKNGERWLAYGTQYSSGATCPFCNQKLEDLKLIEAYQSYFSEEYDNYRNRIETIKKNLEILFSDAKWLTISQSISKNSDLREFWGQFLELPKMEIDSPRLESAIRQFREAALELVDKKLAAPLESIGAGERFRSAESEFDRSKLATNAYCEVVTKVNELIQKKKDETENFDLSSETNKLAVFQAEQIRQKNDVVALCNEHKGLLKRKRTSEKHKETAKEDLDKYSDEMIEKYQGELNAILRSFNAGFSITNTKRSYAGGAPSSSYQILINDHEVNLTGTRGVHRQPTFKTTLSSGDRSALAFAFFLAQLRHDPKHDEKIVIFDDPFNSQDRSRRSRTMELIRKCGRSCAQVIVLSHDPRFLKILWDNIIDRAEVRTLQLSRVGQRNTVINGWDIEKETKDAYFLDHSALTEFLHDGGDATIDIARKIRPVLEGYCRYRFPNEFADNQWLGDMIGVVRNIGETHPLFSALGDLEEINDYSKRFHHEANIVADQNFLDDGELQSYVSRTLMLIGGY